MAASADPDPPAVDGGNVTFEGDWTVDPGDDLLYINQTIVLNGNLTVSPTGVLELVNCSLLLNGTPPTELPMGGVRVGWEGTLNITSGSLVRPLLLAYFIVDAGAHLLVQDSTLEGIGHTAPLSNSGVYVTADDVVIRDSAITGGNHGLILDGVTGAVVENVTFRGPQRKGLYLLGGTTGITLRGLTFTGQMESVSLVDCQGVTVTNMTILDGSYGVDIDNGSITLRNAVVSDLVGAVVQYRTHGAIRFVVDGPSLLLNCTMELNGSLEVLSGGSLSVVNSTVSLANPVAHGANGIAVRTGGNLSVTGGSTVEAASGGFRYEWTVDTGGGLVLDGATVSGAGWDASHPGLVVRSTGNTLRDVAFLDCHTGLTVEGDGNDAGGLTFEDCVVGAVWSSGSADLTDLAFINCTSQGLVLAGARDITVQGCRVTLSAASDGIAVEHSTGIDLRDLNVTGTVDHGVRLRNASDVAMADSYVSTMVALEIEAWSPCYNVTVDATTLIGTSEAVNANGVYGLRLLSVTARGYTFTAWLEGVRGGEVRGSKLTGGSSGCVRLLSSDDVFIDQSILDGGSYVVQMSGCSDVEVSRSLMVGGGYAIHASTTDHLVVSNATIDTMSVWGIYLSGVSDFAILDTLVMDADRRGATVADCDGGTLVNLTVISSDLGIDVVGGGNLTISALSLQGCIDGLRFRSAATAMTLEMSVLEDMALAVNVTGGSNVSVVDCSFLDCAEAIRGDGGSWVGLVYGGVGEVVNCTLTLRGTFTLEASSVLNVTASTIVFSGEEPSEAAMLCKVGSTLRLSGGTLVRGADGTVPFSIVADGRLTVVDTTIVGGGRLPADAAMSAMGDVASLNNVTFRDCVLALALGGMNPTVRECTFSGNRQSVLLAGATRLRIIDCSFGESNGSWDLHGEVSENLQVTGCTFDGGGVVDHGIYLAEQAGQDAVVTLTNVTLSNYTNLGLQDEHRGRLTMNGCILDRASIDVGGDSAYAVVIAGLTAYHCTVRVGEAGFNVTGCVFLNSTFKVHDNSRGSLLRDCTFQGGLGGGVASLDVDGCLQVTLSELDLVDVEVGLHVHGGSDVSVHRLSVQGARYTAVEVNGSIVRMETCTMTGLMGDGVRVWNVGSRLELRNGTVQASPGRTGHDVDASNGGDVWALNTTFNRTSVVSTGAGRVEVIWFVTVEPSLPWGGTLWDPDHLSVVDATGVEVVNSSRADGVLRLREFSEEDGVRTWRTPHSLSLVDLVEGVRYSGDRTIDASRHLVLDLLDAAPPVARAGPDQVVDEDLVVSLDGTDSSDNDPSFRSTGSFRWTFDEYGTEVVLTGDVVKYVFSVPGKFWVNLTVTDAAGNVARDSMIIQVRDRTPPRILFGGNVTLDEDEWHIFDASGTTDNDPAFDFNTGIFLWRIDLGTTTLERDTASFSTAFATPGNLSGTIIVWDKAGNKAERSFWVKVNDITAPFIEGLADAVVFEPTSGLLDASACSDNVGIASYSWTVTFVNWTGGDDDSVDLDGEYPSYTFSRLGTYRIGLILSDAAGNTNGTDLVVVYDDVPVLSVPDWVVGMAGELLEVRLRVSDTYYTQLTTSVVSGPGTVTFGNDEMAPVLVWTPDGASAGSEVTIVIGVHDGLVASQGTLVVAVNPARGEANQPPVISSRPPLSAKRDTPYIYLVEATDPDGDVLGFMMLTGPAGMSISQGGTLSWDPPYERGTVLVDVRITVTDGRGLAEQAWTIRWREPPNQGPSISFQPEPVTVRFHEEFLVDLSVHLQGPEGYDVDPDDPNQVLVWEVSHDAEMVTLVSRDGLTFRFSSRDVKGSTTIEFSATDPSGAVGTTLMDVTVRPGPSGPDDGGPSWMPWLLLGLVVVLASVGVLVVGRRRGRPVREEGPWEDGEDGPDLGPTPEPTSGEAISLQRAMSGVDAGVTSSFVELEDRGVGDAAIDLPGERADLPGGTRVLAGPAEAPGRMFHLDGVAILEANGAVQASTGRVEETLAPYQEGVEEVRRGLRGDGLAVMEFGGRRVLIALRSGIGAVCIIRGREDEIFRSGIRDTIGNLFQDRSTEGALGVIEDILASAGTGDTAEVVHEAWTARLDAELTYQGSVVMLEARLSNDTENILNNVRLRLHHDEDALSVQSVTPKLLVSQGRMALGNVPPRKVHKVAISLLPELCMSSTARLMASYTDMEGRTVHVPSQTLPVVVECPHIEEGGSMEEERLLAASESGLGSTGRRIFNYGMDVDHMALLDLAVGLVSSMGLLKVLSLEDDSLMRAEAWFLGKGEGGRSQVLVRVSSHGADHMLELFVTSDDGTATTGLLTHLGGELLDAAASAMPGKRVERVRDAATLEEMAVWPTLLDYKVMGD